MNFFLIFTCSCFLGETQSCVMRLLHRESAGGLEWGVADGQPSTTAVHSARSARRVHVDYDHDEGEAEDDIPGLIE